MTFLDAHLPHHILPTDASARQPPISVIILIIPFHLLQTLPVFSCTSPPYADPPGTRGAYYVVGLIVNVGVCSVGRGEGQLISVTMIIVTGHEGIEFLRKFLT